VIPSCGISAGMLLWYVNRMAEWIYESPDGGITVTRRVFGQHDNKPDGKHFKIGQDAWLPMGHMIKIAQQHIEEQSLRDKYPVLDDLWKQYRTMLWLVSAGDSK